MANEKIGKKEIRTLTPEEKLNVAGNLYWSARELKKAAIKNENPELSDEEIDAKVKEIFMYART